MEPVFINNLQTVNFPFRDNVELPFSQALVVGLSICVVDDTSDTAAAAEGTNLEIAVGAIAVREDAVTLYMTYKNQYIGNIVAAPGGASEYYTNEGSPLKSYAIATIGRISTADIGSYEGPFLLHPKCSTIVPKAVDGRYEKITINGLQQQPGTVLSLMTAGTLAATAGREPLESAEGSELVGSAYITIYPVQTSAIDINEVVGGLGVSAIDNKTVYTIGPDTLGYRLNIQIEEKSTEKILLECTSDAEGSGGLSVVSLTLDGTSAFPHCYGATDHQNN